MRAMIQDLTTNDERNLILRIDISLSKDIELLTIKDLSDIALILIKPKKNGKMVRCILPAKAIQILISRAIKKNIPIH